MKKTIPLKYALWALLALAGMVAAVWQTHEGLGVTAMREPVVWGLYVVGFAYFLGLGSGALTIAGAAVACRRAEFRETARIASTLAVVALALAGVMITLDLGRPERAWMMALKAQPQSPLIIDFLVLNAMLVLALILTCFCFRIAVHGRSQPLPRLLALPFTIGSGTFLARRAASLVQWIAGLTAVVTPVLYLLTVRVFASLQARPAWHSPLLAPSFLASAMLAGVAAVGLALLLTDAQFTRRPATLVWLRVAVSLAGVSLLFKVSPLLTMLQFTSPPTLTHLDHAGTALALEVGLGLILPVLLLSLGRPGRLRTGLASLLLLAGVFVKRWHVIVSGMRVRNLPLEDGIYSPNLVEITAIVGITAGAVLVLTVLLSVFRSDYKEADCGCPDQAGTR